MRIKTFILFHCILLYSNTKLWVENMAEYHVLYCVIVKIAKYNSNVGVATRARCEIVLLPCSSIFISINLPFFQADLNCRERALSKSRTRNIPLHRSSQRRFVRKSSCDWKLPVSPFLPHLMFESPADDKHVSRRRLGVGGPRLDHGSATPQSTPLPSSAARKMKKSERRDNTGANMWQALGTVCGCSHTRPELTRSAHVLLPTINRSDCSTCS